MYQADDLLARIDAHRWSVLVAFGVDSMFQIAWLVSSLRVARRDRAYSIPLFCTYYWFAHDLSVVLRFHTWFYVYGHWYLELFWFVLLLANLLEWIYLYQVLRYGRQELLPSATPRRFAALLLLGLAYAMVTHEFLRSAFADPLYQMDPTLTMLAYPAFGAAMLLRRRSSRGQSATMWWSFTIMTAGFHAIAYTWYGPAFRSGFFVAAATAATLGGIAMALTVSSTRWRWNGAEFPAER